MIASSAFVALDGILDWPVALYDGSWSQWGQMAGLDASTGGRLLPGDSRLRTDIASRTDTLVYTYTKDPGPVFYTAATTTSVQLNDMSSAGTFTGTAVRSFRVQIDGVGTPNTFKWNNTGSATTWTAQGVAITGAAQAIGTEGMTVTFAATTGHTLDDRWDFITRRPVEELQLDGSSCFAQLNLDGTRTPSSASCTATWPNSSESGNQLEEEDAAYFGAGGSAGGGGPIAPGY